ncbi:MAG: hypothetical protein Q9169_000471 [Polycauliona sp. 2 TL-2023]
MVRAQAYDAGDAEPRRRRDWDHDDSDGDEEPAYDYQDPPRRSKSHQKTGGRHAAQEQEDEDDEDDEEESDERPRRNNKQLAVRQKSRKSKSSGKQVARKKRQESENSSSESSEEEVKRKKEKKKKRQSKSHDEETITRAKWEVVDNSEVDRDFVQILVEELGHHPQKIHEWIGADYLRRHTETGEYNIDLMFDEGVLAPKDKKKWESYVKKAQNDPRRKRKLYNTKKTGETVIGRPSMMAPSMMGMHSMGTSMRPRGGHSYYDPRCDDCYYVGDACGY